VKIDDLVDEQEEEIPEIVKELKPDACIATLAAALDVIVEQCGEETIDIVCDIFGVDREAREKIKEGECKELTKNGLTPCILNSIRALRAYMACRALQLFKTGMSLHRAIRVAWDEVLLEEGRRED